MEARRQTAMLVGNRLEMTIVDHTLTILLCRDTEPLYEWTAPYVEGQVLALTRLDVRLPLDRPIE